VKVELARRLRKETTMSYNWIAQRLRMGSWTFVSNLINAPPIAPPTGGTAALVSIVGTDTGHGCWRQTTGPERDWIGAEVGSLARKHSSEKHPPLLITHRSIRANPKPGAWIRQWQRFGAEYV